MNELAKRVSVALIGIPFALFAIWSGGLIFLISIMLISSLVLWEYYTISESKAFQPNKIAGIILGVVLQFLIFWKFESINQYLLPLLMVYILIVMMLELFSHKANPLVNIAVTITGNLYISMMLGSLIAIREFPRLFTHNQIFAKLRNGIDIDNSFAYLVIALFVTVWICDSAAYFIGKALGKHKLYPKVSPKKSWEGAIAGFIASIITFTLIISFFIDSFPLIHSIIIGLLIGIFGQIGDLVESLLKRDAGIKDSSTILPGHGGFLDRFDSIIFVAPILFVYIYVLFCLI